MGLAFARDLILRATSRYPFHAQMMLSNQLGMQKCSTLFHVLLSSLRVTYSTTRSDTSQCDFVLRTLMKGRVVEDYDYPIVSRDNFGQLIKGMKAGYSQWIIFQDIIIRQPRLKEIKIHCNNIDQQLCRKPKHRWMDLCKHDKGTLAQQIVGVKDSDFVILSHAVMEGIRNAINLELTGKFCIGGLIPRAGYIIDQDTMERVESERGFRNYADDGSNASVQEQEIPRMFNPDHLNEETDNQMTP
jgi:hypothetical protein